MDKLAALGEQLSQVTVYDLKTYYNQAKNIVLQVSEMEAKVLEATNEDAWGASSSLMQEIAQGTFNFQEFNQIMPTIYKRFMEKEAREWRQIYKALMLLEYLIKHGSERVVDDARSHVSTIKMLRNFHYIDEKGKDEGINVRNRAKEIGELLSDVEKIRSERRKAKANRSKYIGVGNDAGNFGGGGGGGGGGGASFATRNGGRFGGFGSDSLGGGGGGGSGGYDSDQYNGGSSRDEYNGHSSSGRGSGGGGGGGSSSFRDTSARAGFDEYDAGDDEDRVSSPPPPRASASVSRTNKATPAPPKETKGKEPAPKAVDLFDFTEDDYAATAAAPSSSFSSAPPPAAAADDDFDDFQQAPSSTTTSTGLSFASAPAPPAKAADLFDFFADPAPAPASLSAIPSFTSTSTAPKPSYTHQAQPPVYSPPPPQQQQQQSQPNFFAAAASKPNYTSTPSYSNTSPANAPLKPASSAAAAGKSAGGFDDLWASSLGSFGSGSGSAAAKPKAAGMGAGAGAGAKKSMLEMEKEKAEGALWGAAPQQGGAGGNEGNGGGFDDLLL